MADSNVLLVEGKDDEHVLYALLQHYGVPEVFKIKDKEGINNLLGTLDVELLASELGQLGVIIDADNDLVGVWNRTARILKTAGYSNIPAVPSPQGTIISEPGLPKFGIWIMPDNVLPGMLEHFISFLVPAGDKLWKQAQDCIDDISDVDRRFPPAHTIKAHIHTWLAWQSDPGTPFGLAITKKYLEPGSVPAQQLMDWITRLFS